MMGPSPGLAHHQGRWATATCTIARPAGDPVFDPATGTYTDPAATEVYSGPAQIIPTGSDRVVDFGERATSLRQYDVTVVGLAQAVHVEDLVTVTAADDPQLDGLELRVLDVKKSSLPTNRRLACEEVLA